MNESKVLAHCREVKALMDNVIFEVQQNSTIPVVELVSANKLLVQINKER